MADGLSYASSDGLRIAYSHAGTGPPIVFLHGVGSTGEIWRRQLIALSQSALCIAVDYRGYGRSDAPQAAALDASARGAQSISRSSFARDVLAVLDACRLPSAHLCGCSLGGVVAMECYAQASERVRSLVLVDTFAFIPGGAESVEDRMSALDALGIEAFAESRSPGVLVPDAPADRIELVRRQMASIPLSVYKAATRATWSADYRSLLPRIDVPVMVMWGERDTTIAPYERSAEIAYSLREPCPVVVVPNAGHLPNIDNPEFFNQALATFVRGVDASA